MATELEKEYERCVNLRGFRYGIHEFEAALYGVEALKKWNDSTEQNYLKHESKKVPGVVIDRKMKELLAVVACVAQKDKTSHIVCHMWAAHKAGCSAEEMMAIIYHIIPWVGGVAKLTALEAWRATFRPDIPSIDRVCELGDPDYSIPVKLHEQTKKKNGKSA
jgi:alkylhydroperoxidase/carboxymuconolactone decarboxylase family protein YurZ